MRFKVNNIVFPDGDIQEIPHRLSFNQMVDVNGYPMQLPLKTVKTLAYRVYKITSESNINEDISYYHLEQMLPEELAEYVR